MDRRANGEKESFFPGVKAVGGVKLTAYHLVSRTGMSGSIHLLSLCGFMAWTGAAFTMTVHQLICRLVHEYAIKVAMSCLHKLFALRCSLCQILSVPKMKVSPERSEVGRRGDRWALNPAVVTATP